VPDLSASLTPDLSDLLRGAVSSERKVIVLTGAGVSAESGIPTFRGREGYWTIGSRDYHPQELATRAAFRRMPLDVWGWYLYRRGVCRAAAPNPAHAAVVALEEALGDRFLLVTQNVDGLHLRAGSSPARTFEIHGNLDYLRCAAECTPARYPLPDDATLARGAAVPADLAARLVCPECGQRARPHVLWFDESYDEPRYRLHSALAAAADAGLVVIAGTSAQTTLPWRIVEHAVGAGARIIDVNVEDNPFAEIARDHGVAITSAAAAALPAIASILAAVVASA
jgi:NAD-dependent deacetylase